METTLQATIEKIESGYARLVRLYRRLPVSALIEPALPNGWSFKDTLAHIAAWEWRCASLLNEAHQTDLPLKAIPDVEALNLEIQQERREWSWAEVEAEFRQAHETLLGVIRELPPKRLNHGLVQQTIAEETWEHYAEHLPDLERWHERVNSGQ
jgi:uncharacterized protein DUF1706